MADGKESDGDREPDGGLFADAEWDAAPLDDAVEEPIDSAVPDVPFTMLTALPLSEADWAEIAARAPWQTTRMNLNTFARHGVFDRPEMVSLIATIVPSLAKAIISILAEHSRTLRTDAVGPSGPSAVR